MDTQFYIGKKLNPATREYQNGAAYCNSVGDRHIAAVNGEYIIVANEPATEPTTAEKVAELEAQTGLTRPMREMVLADGSGASEYVREKAQEIEDLAEQLRKEEEPEAV